MIDVERKIFDFSISLRSQSHYSLACMYGPSTSKLIHNIGVWTQFSMMFCYRRSICNKNITQVYFLLHHIINFWGTKFTTSRFVVDYLATQLLTQPFTNFLQSILYLRMILRNVRLSGKENNNASHNLSHLFLMICKLFLHILNM